MPTIKEIAELANVSSSTVSRILNGDESIQVSLETRKRVLSVAEKLNYIVKSNKNTNNAIGTIAITNWYTKEITLADLFMRSILWGLESTLKTAGYKIIRSDFNDSLPDKNTIDGIIAVGEYHGKNLQQLRNLNKPLVIINQDTLYEDISCVTIDFKYSVTKIIEYFEQEGHEKIGMIEGKNKYSLENHKIHVMDTFDYFRYAKKKGLQYDVIVLDPPSFARNGKKVFTVAKNYGDLITDSLPILADKGMIVASTNASNVTVAKFKNMIEKSFQAAHVQYRLVERYQLPADFVANEKYEESNYLKVFIYQKL